ncbi:hypothetical protein [Actinomadura bangladeshensis]|uniref:Uncharacterized protein n=1 Tax=Actinomadura bangladeshensis TaxID=453573 RepID=A0A6L9QAU1_9ACTN|nr:hypothetical protein [Actinomadura bangladeshensis]NEA21561.1 hypothetical protein [Actinomadura bangladeshensis]NEA22521.1 hypothetical protein [Actinomadura bangladeshensis]
MSSSEEQHARKLAGAANQEALERIARHLHANESLHMHQRVGDKDPCEYCWLRAGKALWALREAAIPVVLGPDPVAAGEPVEVDAEVLHALEVAGLRRRGEEVQGWTCVHIEPERKPWSERLLVFRDQDRRHYGVTFNESFRADPASRIICRPVTPHYEVVQRARYELTEAVPRG